MSINLISKFLHVNNVKGGNGRTEGKCDRKTHK